MAAVEQWPKLFQNMRATRETELSDRFPIHVVCAWLGNSPATARKHYLQVTDDHFAQAVANDDQKIAAKSAAAKCASGGNQRIDESDAHEKRRDFVRIPDVVVESVPPRGVETGANSPRETALSEQGGAESGALGARGGADSAPVDPELQVIIDAWPALPGAVKAGILATIKAAKA